METFGLEIEGYGATRSAIISALAARNIACQGQTYNHTTCSTWKIVSDASIHGTGVTDAFELVSPVLNADDAGYAQVLAVFAALNSVGAKINNTCGMHVHVGASTMDATQMARLVKIFYKYEKTIDMIVAPSRRDNANGYCKSIRDRVQYAAGSTQLAACFAKLSSYASIQALSAAVNGTYSDSRYFKLNLTAFWRHGTVEFRQHQGTMNGSKAVMWIKLCVGMVEYAKSTRTISARTRTATLKATRYVYAMVKQLDRTQLAQATARCRALNGNSAMVNGATLY